jgi:hypothetical protein
VSANSKLIGAVLSSLNAVILAMGMDMRPNIHLAFTKIVLPKMRRILSEKTLIPTASSAMSRALEKRQSFS